MYRYRGSAAQQWFPASAGPCAAATRLIESRVTCHGHHPSLGVLSNRPRRAGGRGGREGSGRGGPGPAARVRASLLQHQGEEREGLCFPAVAEGLGPSLLRFLPCLGACPVNIVNLIVQGVGQLIVPSLLDQLADSSYRVKSRDLISLGILFIPVILIPQIYPLLVLPLFLFLLLNTKSTR